MIRDMFLHTAELAEVLIASRKVTQWWDDPSALESYTVAGLAGHLARAILTVARYLDEAPPDLDAPPIDATGYFVQALSDHDPVASDIHARVRKRGGQEAAHGKQALVDRLHANRLDLAECLPALAPDHRVGVFGGASMLLDDYLKTRLVELVVHIDDLAVSVDDDVAVSAEALETVAAVLAGVAVRRVGGLPTIRSLARRERHPNAIRAL